MPGRTTAKSPWSSLQSDRQRVREVSGADTYAGLAAIEARYDPDDVFHHAADVAPHR